jgi:hypothetical protein
MGKSWVASTPFLVTSHRKTSAVQQEYQTGNVMTENSKIYCCKPTLRRPLSGGISIQIDRLYSL